MTAHRWTRHGRPRPRARCCCTGGLASSGTASLHQLLIRLEAAESAEAWRAGGRLCRRPALVAARGAARRRAPRRGAVPGGADEHDPGASDGAPVPATRGEEGSAPVSRRAAAFLPSDVAGLATLQEAAAETTAPATKCVTNEPQNI